MIKISLARARRAQRTIASKVVLENGFKHPLKTIAGVDVSFRRGKMFGAAVLMSYPELSTIDEELVELEAKIPYIPTFLAFREVPAMIKAIKKLKVKPDIILVDANGILHPLRAGEATHLGVVLRIPTIGVAKSLLCGEVIGKGEIKEVRLKGEVIGYELMIKGKPIYVSPGHLVSFKSSIEVVFKTIKNRVPEPIKKAHSLATRAARGFKLSKMGQ